MVAEKIVRTIVTEIVTDVKKMTDLTMRILTIVKMTIEQDLRTIEAKATIVEMVTGTFKITTKISDLSNIPKRKIFQDLWM